MPTEIELLAVKIDEAVPATNAMTDLIWTAPPPVQVIDCVLSLNRQYDSFVLPRVKAFLAAHPEVVTCSNLMSLIGEFDSPTDFMSAELRFNYTDRAETLAGVARRCVEIQAEFPGADERERLRTWAVQTKPAAHTTFGVKGFGIAGFQYLRMLFGADTLKPDVHITRFVVEAIGRPVGPIEAVGLLEAAGTVAARPLRQLDVSIWENRARTASIGIVCGHRQSQ